MMSTIALESLDIAALPSLPLSDRASLPKVSAVYFVLEERVVIYVGSTENLSKRWKAHNKLKQLEARLGELRIAWLEVKAASIVTAIENAMIKLFEPEFNISGSNRPEIVNARYWYGEKKKPCQFMLTQGASDILDKLACAAKISRSEHLEQMIRQLGQEFLDTLAS